ncbi:MAG: ornithine cyclodeaminase family protein, partial [Sphingomonadales bacterium]
AMGADSPTKQELGHALAQASRLFADVPAQSVTMGEFRSASAAGVVSIEDVTPLGAVIRGFAPGRVSAEDVTIFDSSGMALQDLAISSLVLEKMDARG